MTALIENLDMRNHGQLSPTGCESALPRDLALLCFYMMDLYALISHKCLRSRFSSHTSVYVQLWSDDRNSQQRVLMVFGL